MKILIRSLFVLVLAGISCFIIAACLDGQFRLISHMEEIKVAIGQQDESPEDSDGLREGFNTDGGCNRAPLPFPFEALFYREQTHTATLCQAVTIRQFQVNLLNSFRAPAMFILFHT